MQNKALDELRRLVAYLCQAAGIALPNIAAMVGGAEPMQVARETHLKMNALLCIYIG